MKKIWLAIALVIALVVAAVGIAGTAAGDRGADKHRPLKISIEFTFGPGTQTCEEPELFVPFLLEGTGVATHLGRFDIVAPNCLNPVTGEMREGRGIYTAANDDELYADFVGALTQGPEFEGVGSGVITGGTGRFESATGSYDWTVTGTIDAATGTGTASFQADGMIAYDASDRSN